MSRNGLVPCNDCPALLPPERMRQKVEQWCRTVGAGGTNTGVKLQKKLPEFLCDACVKRRETQGVMQPGLLGDA